MFEVWVLSGRLKDLGGENESAKLKWIVYEWWLMNTVFEKNFSSVQSLSLCGAKEETEGGRERERERERETERQRERQRDRETETETETETERQWDSETETERDLKLCYTRIKILGKLPVITIHSRSSAYPFMRIQMRTTAHGEYLRCLVLVETASNNGLRHLSSYFQ